MLATEVHKSRFYHRLTHLPLVSEGTFVSIYHTQQYVNINLHCECFERENGLPKRKVIPQRLQQSQEAHHGGHIKVNCM